MSKSFHNYCRKWFLSYFLLVELTLEPGCPGIPGGPGLPTGPGSPGVPAKPSTPDNP